MKKTLALLAMILCLALPAGARAEQKDATGCKDHPLFTRMPGYWIHSCAQKQFDSRPFVVAKGKTVTVEGPSWRIFYLPQATWTTKPSDIQILRNYENAVGQLGGTLVYGEKGKDTFRINRGGQEIWVEVTAEFTGKYQLYIVQKGAMQQDVQANADVFAQDLRATGHAAVYGIHFDTNKATLKPESTEVIAEIAKLLKTDLALKIFVVGHTDGAGGIDSNLELSRARAEAVLQALVRDHGIAAARLRSFGCGQFAPVATNATEEGKAKNRRVELVKQ
ncbi:MAG: OmpA family protein [Acidobacteria bacterium]|nr:OmpA family protein [Acidobacteriota bacterium]